MLSPSPLAIEMRCSLKIIINASNYSLPSCVCQIKWLTLSFYNAEKVHIGADSAVVQGPRFQVNNKYKSSWSKMFVHESVTGFQTGVQIVPSPATGEWHSWLWTWASRLMRVVGEELSILLYIFWFSLFFCHYMYLLILEEPNVNMTRSCLSAEPELPVSGRAPAESGSLHEAVMGTVECRPESWQHRELSVTGDLNSVIMETNSMCHGISYLYLHR